MTKAIAFINVFILLFITGNIFAENRESVKIGRKMSDWLLIDEWGKGSKTYIDQSSIEDNSGIKRAWIKYYMEPPGKDKISQKDVKEMLMLEEYDCKQRKFCVDRIIFNYLDGSSGEPLTPEHQWAPVTGRKEIIFRFICKST